MTTAKRVNQKTRFYCYECLRKYGRKYTRKSTVCSHCGIELRACKNARTRAATVTRLKRHRGIPVNRKRGGKRHSAKDEYGKYLASPLWAEIRTRVLERDKHTCQDCGGPANQVHHLSYSDAVMAGKDDSQLVSLCGDCHQIRHGLLEPSEK